MDDAEIERLRARFLRSLDGRWVTMGTRPGTPAHAVWVFRGERGFREAKGSYEAFRVSWTGDQTATLSWENGDEDELTYDFVRCADTGRRSALVSRGRAVFLFEGAPLGWVDGR